MHTIQRSLVAASCATAALVLSGTALVGQVVGRAEVEQTLQQAIDDAARDYRYGFGVRQREQQARDVMDAQQAAIAAIMSEKHAVRLRVAELRQQREGIVAEFGSGAVAEVAAGGTRREQEIRLLRLLTQFTRLTHELTAGPEIGSALAQNLLPDDGTETVLRSALIHLGKLVDASLRLQRVESDLAAAEARHAQLLFEYVAAEANYREAGEVAESTAEQREAIAATVKDVHAQVIALQSQLAAIDERLRRHAAASLVEKGLLDPSMLGETAHAGAPVFHWPVYGTVSAGFQDRGYERRFGVPHQGIDIPVAQGSPVMASAEGVVFLSRDGGATGYSYVLVGHASGFATLYGHLSRIDVSPGDEVAAGDQIGLSGGTPGTVGAGPMTTGAHLHFEMIRDGVHLDPETVLP